MAAWASVNMATLSRVVCLLVALSSSLVSVARSASQASWLYPMWVLLPTQDCPLCHTTECPAAPESTVESRSVRVHGQPRLALFLHRLGFGLLLLHQLRVEGFWFLQQDCALHPTRVSAGVLKPLLLFPGRPAED